MKLTNYEGEIIEENKFYTTNFRDIYFVKKDEKRRLIGYSPTMKPFLLEQNNVCSFMEIQRNNFNININWMEKMLAEQEEDKKNNLKK